MKYQKFKDSVKEAVARFRQIEKNEPARVIAHLDADGIAACSILVKVLNSENMRYSISIVPQLTTEIIDSFAKEKHKNYFFVDIGSGRLKTIAEKLKGKNIFIFDHHGIEGETKNPDVVHVNPNVHDIDGGREISGSGIVYLFAKELDPKNIDLAHIAIVGAIGDVQEDNGFQRLNDEILQTAIDRDLIEVKRGFKFFGTYSKPIHKLLQYCEPKIPEIYGDEFRTIEFLQELGIPHRNGYEFRKLCDLTDAEKKKLASGIIIKRMNEEKPEDIFANNYLLVREKGAFKDVREFSTILNACGRLQKASLGIGACLGDEKLKRKAVENLSNYKKEITGALAWFNGNTNSFIKGKKYMIINAESNILSTIAGTLGSILSKSGNYEKGTLIMTMARSADFTKVSLRVVSDTSMDLRDIVSEITAKAGGEAGGHKLAAGAIISKDNEENFIKIAEEVMKKFTKDL